MKYPPTEEVVMAIVMVCVCVCVQVVLLLLFVVIRGSGRSVYVASVCVVIGLNVLSLE